MRIGFDNALGPTVDALKLRSERTELIASNIANADTPQFKSRDIDFKGLLGDTLARSGVTTAALRTTHTNHLVGGSEISAEGRLLYRTPLLPSLDGNTVDVHAEQAQFAENNLQFQAAFDFLSRRFQGLIEAIRGE